MVVMAGFAMAEAMVLVLVLVVVVVVVGVGVGTSVRADLLLGASVCDACGWVVAFVCGVVMRRGGARGRAGEEVTRRGELY